MSTFDMTEQNFLSNESDVFSFGRIPVRIDILTDLKGVVFDEAYDKSEIHEIGDIPVRVIHYKHLIESRKAAGRYKDLDDIEQLENKS